MSLLIWHKQTKEVLACLPQPTGGIITAADQFRVRGIDPSDYEWREISEHVTTSVFRRDFYISDTGYQRKTDLVPIVTEGEGISTVVFDSSEPLTINVDGEDYEIESVNGRVVLELESAIPETFTLSADQRTYRLQPLTVEVF